MSSTLPPLVSGGLPVIGHTIEMIRNRDQLFKRGYAEHGDVFALKLGPQFAAVVTGESHNREFYTQTDKLLNMQDGYAFLKEAVGEVLFTASVETYYNQRPALQEVFRRERMVSYIEAMQREVQKWLNSLGGSGKIDFTEAMLRLTQRVAGHAFFGPNFEAELDDDLWKQYGIISESLDPVLPPNLPLPKFWRRDRARREIGRTMAAMIEKRRQHPDQYDDLITALLNTPLKDGTIMDDETIVSMFTGLIFAGHETTAGQAAWLVTLLMQHPDYLSKVMAEIEAHVPYGAPVDAHVLMRLDHLYWAIDETTRLRPSADTQLRTVNEPLTLGEYVIPQGWRVLVSAATSHHLADVFSNPEQFDPLRFSPARAEGKNTFSIVGFGGGIHKCTGMNFAKNEMAMIAALFFQQFEAELLNDDIHVVMGHGANHPSPVWVRYQRKALPEASEKAAAHHVSGGACPV